MNNFPDFIAWEGRERREKGLQERPGVISSVPVSLEGVAVELSPLQNASTEDRGGQNSGRVSLTGAAGQLAFYSWLPECHL